MKTFLTLALCACCCLTAAPQSAHADWEQAVHDLIMATDDDEVAQWEQAFELLSELAREPIDLNQATREQLEQLVFLSSQQLEDLQEYLDRYRPVRSLNELRLIPSLDPERLRLLPYFIYAREEPPENAQPPLRDALRHGHHELIATARVPFYERRGDQNGYLGYPYRHWVRYDFSASQRLRVGLVGSQDAGEPFFANRNHAGYDFYSFYFQLRKWGRLEQAVAGKYKLQTAMGLVVNTNFTPGKTSVLSTLGRPATTLRPHASRSADDYFQGAAATVRLSRPLKATFFASLRPMDATLNAPDGAAAAGNASVATIVRNGYHRTPTEMARKNNLTTASGGANFSLRLNAFRLGATALYTHYSRPLQPNTSVLYRRHNAHGSHFFNASLDYGYTSHAFSAAGETAISRDGAVATLHTASLQPSREVSLMALHRFYSYRYTSPFARSFSEGSAVQNESGLYLGATWQPRRRLRMQAYTDYAYFAWARYQASQSSHAWDNLFSLSYQPAQWTLSARYRLHLRQKDQPAATPSAASVSRSLPLANHWEHRARLSAGFPPHGKWRTTTQADAAHTDGHTGLALSQRLAFSAQRWQWQAAATWFHANAYNARLYIYERSPRYTFNFPMLYGRGLRASLLARTDVGRRLSLTAKLTWVHYTDRDAIGTGLQQVSGSSVTDLDVQARWKL